MYKHARQSKKIAVEQQFSVKKPKPFHPTTQIVSPKSKKAKIKKNHAERLAAWKEERKNRAERIADIAAWKEGKER
jgi:hypothetical protein